MKKIYLLIIITIIQSLMLNAQQIMTLDDAISKSLKNNYNIMIARNKADITIINNTKGNAGMLPEIALRGGATYEVNNIHQEYSSGANSDYSSLSTTALSAGAELNWTIYDGGKMFVSKDKLNQIQALGEVQYKAQVQNTIYQIRAKYYEIIKQKQQLKSINEVMNYNQERVKIADAGFNAGTLAKTDLLQAKIDLNIVRENSITQEFNIKSLKKELYDLLGDSNYMDYEVTDSIPVDFTPDRNSIIDKLNNSNMNILAYQKQIEIAKLAIEEIRSEYLPQLNISAGYYFSNSKNSDGSMLLNRSLGPQLGANLSFPIYSGGETDRKIAESKMQVQSSEYELTYLKIQLQTELDNLLTDFENQKELHNIESDNINLAKENLEIVIDKLKYGRTTSLEVHQAQDDYMQSSTRLLNFRYNLKIAETKIKQLIAEF